MFKSTSPHLMAVLSGTLLGLALTLAIEALADDGCHHNPEAASSLLNLLRLTLPSLRQARLYSYIPEDEPIDALPA